MLFSTARDYGRFLQMLLNRGILNGRRLLAPHTVALMTQNHVGELFAQSAHTSGLGFGLGFEILLDPGAAGIVGSPGTYDWTGFFGTAYWVDPAEDLIGLCFVQVDPEHGSEFCRKKFRSLVYQALVDASPARQ